ncbi:hypothetical protein H0H92_011050 [Tricholoma furcatifolium]|nr:hypothetical protein H0H92_011050 [Tricholoma furcatifolium]
MLRNAGTQRLTRLRRSAGMVKRASQSPMSAPALSGFLEKKPMQKTLKVDCQRVKPGSKSAEPSFSSNLPIVHHSWAWLHRWEQIGLPKQPIALGRTPASSFVEGLAGKRA